MTWLLYKEEFHNKYEYDFLGTVYCRFLLASTTRHCLCWTKSLSHLLIGVKLRTSLNQDWNLLNRLLNISFNSTFVIYVQFIVDFCENQIGIIICWNTSHQSHNALKSVYLRQKTLRNAKMLRSRTEQTIHSMNFAGPLLNHISFTM